jgi:Cdc6-like AAA superfamily ATPase
LYENSAITPDVVRDALATASEHYLLIIILDEFDRLPDPADTQLFADTIKTLSDFAVKATIVLVGVADAVDDLIGGHESIQRNLEQIPMPRMSEQELRQIITDRLPRVEMGIEPDALKKICVLSRGLPHYTHYIGQYSAWAAVDAGSGLITSALVADAVKTGINKTQQTVQSAYHKATMSPRKDNLFAEVLLACALAQCDDYGYFAAADVRSPLSEIMEEDYGISRFIGHLGKFCEDSRGAILQEIGERYQRRFRFKNPLMQPYIVMRGVAAEMITLDQLRDYPQIPST